MLPLIFNGFQIIPASPRDMERDMADRDPDIDAETCLAAPRSQTAVARAVRRIARCDVRRNRGARCPRNGGYFPPGHACSCRRASVICRDVGLIGWKLLCFHDGLDGSEYDGFGYKGPEPYFIPHEAVWVLLFQSLHQGLEILLITIARHACFCGVAQALVNLDNPVLDHTAQFRRHGLLRPDAFEIDRAA